MQQTHISPVTSQRQQNQPASQASGLWDMRRVAGLTAPYSRLSCQQTATATLPRQGRSQQGRSMHWITEAPTRGRPAGPNAAAGGDTPTAKLAAWPHSQAAPQPSCTSHCTACRTMLTARPKQASSRRPVDGLTVVSLPPLATRGSGWQVPRAKGAMSSCPASTRSGLLGALSCRHTQ